MKAFLISSFRLGHVSRTDIAPPLNLLYIASVLRLNDCEPELLDLNLVPVSSDVRADDERLEAIRKGICDTSPELVGISCLTTSHFPFARKAAALVRACLPRARVVLGGVHATLFCREILQNCPEFDYVVMGEGEEQAQALVAAIRSRSLDDLSHIQSFGWRSPSGEIRVNPRRSYLENLDLVPFPAWDLVDFSLYYRDHSNWYNPKGHTIRMSVPILATRSCPYDCNFCSAHETMGRGFRRRSPKHVVDEMAYHVETFGHNYFGFADDNLTLNKKYVLEVCEEIVRRGLDIQFESFNGYNLASLDEEVVAALATAGCVYGILPIEHGSDWMRNDIIGKRLSREKIFEVMHLYRKHRIQTRAMFIMGFPEETDETLEETRLMINDLSPDLADVFTLIPFPGTKVFRQALQERLFIRDVDEKTLWTGELPLNTKGSEFYIKPRAMSLPALARWRSIFDDLSADLLARRSARV